MAIVYERITDRALPNWSQLQASQSKITYSHIIDMQEGLRLAINKNFTDIKRMFKGELPNGNSALLDGASISRYEDEILQDNDNKIPTSKQVFKALEIVSNTVTPGILVQYEEPTEDVIWGKILN